jgi:hypothetical protein
MPVLEQRPSLALTCMSLYTGYLHAPRGGVGGQVGGGSQEGGSGVHRRQVPLCSKQQVCDIVTNITHACCHAQLVWLICIVEWNIPNAVSSVVISSLGLGCRRN